MLSIVDRHVIAREAAFAEQLSEGVDDRDFPVDSGASHKRRCNGRPGR